MGELKVLSRCRHDPVPMAWLLEYRIDDHFTQCSLSDCRTKMVGSDSHFEARCTRQLQGFVHLAKSNQFMCKVDILGAVHSPSQVQRMYCNVVSAGIRTEVFDLRC